MSEQQDQRIRELAYQIWESEGRPEGEEARHWEMARKLAESEQQGETAKPATRARKAATKPTAATPAAQPKPARSARGTRSAASESAPATPAAPKGDTEAEAGAPKTMRKPRATKAAKKSDS